ncbi:MAG: hypothetical protein JWP63_3699 [Candidatus Solibacter sp.]|jgi:hypothetical protein|nr:hypothetical protein [Candidatus Solibacter sp.]
MHVARRSVARSMTAYPGRGAGESVSEVATAHHHPGAAALRTTFPEAQSPASGFPIWFAVLMASSCRAKANGENRAIRWDCDAGRAVYTNRGGDAERIEPLGVSLMGGQTLAVYWMPGETAYTVEVYRQNEKCA